MTTRLLPLLSLPLALAGCVESSITEDPVVTAWQDLGPARVAEAPEEVGPDFVSPPVEGGVEELAGSELVLRGYDVARGREVRMTLDRAALAEVGDDVRARGLDRSFIPDDIDSDTLHDTVRPLGWSDNDDSRTRRTNTTAWPYRTIGTLFDGSGDCTGTRIGPRHVLTAAHCIYNRSTSSWNTINFTPGRDGADDAPYGSSGAIWYWVPEGYLDGASGLNGYDIGLIILDEPVGSGWMGYVAYSGSYLRDRTIYMRGYPRCNTTGAPDGCEPKTLWGDTASCEIGTLFNADGDGWNREITTNCDGSAGQSGSAFYFYSPSSGNPVATGVFSHHYCLGACTGSQAQFEEWPNVMTRITPTYLDVISYFRDRYPE